jgi:hypothetical protein
MALGAVILYHFDMKMGHTAVQSDPLRNIEAVTAGVSFLGAGTIIRRGSTQAVGGYHGCLALVRRRCRADRPPIAMGVSHGSHGLGGSHLAGFAPDLALVRVTLRAASSGTAVDGDIAAPER